MTVDFREKAPRVASATMYLDQQGKLRPRHRAGAWAAGVPGTVRGLGLAHARWGKLPWPELVQPAVALARDGLPDLGRSGRVAERSAPKTSEYKDRPGKIGRLGDFPESVAALGRPDKAPWKAGDRLIQKDLAATLARIAPAGPDEFYTGETARLIGQYMDANDGRITGKTWRTTRPRSDRPSTRVSAVSTSGAWALPRREALSCARCSTSLSSSTSRPTGLRAPRTVHRVTEAMRRAYFNRAMRLGDLDFMTVPRGRADLEASRAEHWPVTIGDHATNSASLAPFPILAPEPEHTTHLSAIDAAGNAVALTYTLEDSYGAKAVVAGAGFLLNNEMGDFNLIPGRTDTSGRIGTPANLIAPGKRMLSSMTPTIVLEKANVRIVTGSPGGRTIPNTTLWVVLGLLEFGMEPRAAVDAPRTHHQWFP